MTITTPRLLAALAGLLLATATSARPPDGGGFLDADDLADHVSPELDRRLVDEVNQNLATLQRTGKATAPTLQAVSGMGWPLGPVNGAGTQWHGISNFVDLNPGYPNQLQDYTCSTRTYDTEGGYNHRGIDYFIWPFPWTLMDAGAVDVLAVAPGTLVAKADGFNDRSCSFNAPDTPNYVVIQHADGSVARYLHLKNGSVTTLAIGSPVPAGTPLGKVGSSGVSTGPHLHLELRVANSVGAAVVEPHAGACNANPQMTFAQVRPYRDPRINRLSTHSAPPQMASCPSTVDTPNFSNRFVPGDSFSVMAGFRDQVAGTSTQYRLLRPDGSVFTSWSQVAGTTYNGAWWYWNFALPTNAPLGLWAVEATYEGRTTRHSFQVADATPAAPSALPVDLSGSWYNTATPGQGFNLDMVNENRFILYFYGFGNEGEQLWLFGDFDPGAPSFAWDVPVTLDMYVLEGGGFQTFPAPASRVWGTARLIFESCKRATIELTGESGTQILQLDKLNTTRGLGCP
jgi:murein DD-endopeptidase MepM/ murein hydrolase activator NlpD